MKLEYVKYAIKNISHRKLRSGLTMIGIFIGIAAVVALISIGQGMQNAINEEFSKAGADRITVRPGGGFGGMYVTATLCDHDVDVVSHVRNVDFATGIVMQTARVKYRDETKSSFVFGVNTDEQTRRFIEGVDFFLIENGRQFKSGDKQVAILGYNTAKDMFDREIRIGDKITVEDRELRVIGTQKKSGSPMHDNMVRIPFDIARELFEFEDAKEVSTIMAKVKPGAIPSAVAEDIKRTLRRDHNVKEGKEDFTVETVEQIIAGFMNILVIVQVVLVGIAAISLVVGGIGIMNTMYTSVVERTHEIGIMKSVGAKNSDIVSIFLIESAILGFFGGIIGIILGLAVSKGIELAAVASGVTILKAYFGPEIIAGALLLQEPAQS